MKSQLIVMLPLLATALCGQNLQPFSEAVTVLEARASNGLTQVVNAQPPGLTSVGVVSAHAPGVNGPAARAVASWFAGSSMAHPTFWLEQEAHVFAAGGSASLGPMEMRASFMNPGAPIVVQYEIEVVRVASAGLTATIAIDVDDDGVFEHTGPGTFLGTRTVGATPLRFRIATNLDCVAVGTAMLDVRINITPSIGISANQIAAPCLPYVANPLFAEYRASVPFTPQTPSVELRLVGGVFPVVPIQVIGWGQALAPIPGLPSGCLLVPTLDVVLSQDTLTIPLPQSVRPITFYAQGFSFGQTMLPQNLIAHEAFRITAL